MTVIKRVWEELMHAAQEDIKNSSGYFEHGEAAIYFCSKVPIFVVLSTVIVGACKRRGRGLS